jgi:hypothetical protein
MSYLPFGQPGRFYRGNLHTHSTRSDGRLDPAEVVAAYRERGYDFLALTDHFMARFGFPITDTREFQTADFTTLLGAELHAPQIESGELWHILADGLPLDFAPSPPDETGPMLAARAAAAGAFVGIAHPAWYTLMLSDALALESAHAVEVYNNNCSMEDDRGESFHLYEMLLAKGRRLLAYAADDAHFHLNQPDAFGGWVQVWAEHLTPEAILAGLKAGRFYSSQGPELRSISVEADQITIECSPCQVVIVSGSSPHAAVERSSDITQCTLRVPPRMGPYLRVSLVDAVGKRAWSNPIWRE